MSLGAPHDLLATANDKRDRLAAASQFAVPSGRTRMQFPRVRLISNANHSQQPQPFDERQDGSILPPAGTHLYLLLVANRGYRVVREKRQRGKRGDYGGRHHRVVFVAL